MSIPKDHRLKSAPRSRSLSPKLLVISSAPATRLDNGNIFVDIKFFEGMTIYKRMWPGPVAAILRDKGELFPFGREIEVSALPFQLNIVSRTEEIIESHVESADVVLCGGDDHSQLHLPELLAGMGKKIFFTIEYTPETRRQIVSLDRDRPWFKKLYSQAWLIKQEFRRQKAFSSADGLQANGYPALDEYRRMNPNILGFLDSRMTQSRLATTDEMAARRARLHEKNEPLRLISSGRLEPMKGAQDLIPICRSLAANGVNFEIDIFGCGSLSTEIEQGLLLPDIAGRVRLHEPVDYESVLVPFARRHADISIICNRQSDPSCSYLENMGCGLPVVGYSNRMWSALRNASGGGWVSPMGNWYDIVETIKYLEKNPNEIFRSAEAALHYAQSHLFEAEFSKRVEHLKRSVA